VEWGLIKVSTGSGVAGVSGASYGIVVQQVLGVGGEEEASEGWMSQL
jgi:hypothetical protein